MTGLYTELKDAGVDIGSHESDLYFPVTEQTTAILAKYPDSQKIAIRFVSQIDGTMQYDVPFAYTPFWDKKPR